jgi:hypothetical protein
MLVVVIIVAALIGTALAAALLLPFWGSMKRALHRAPTSPPDASRPVRVTKGQTAFNVAVISGVISLLIGLASWAVFSINDPVTIVFLSWAGVGMLVWAIFGRRY